MVISIGKCLSSEMCMILSRNLSPSDISEICKKYNRGKSEKDKFKPNSIREVIRMRRNITYDNFKLVISCMEKAFINNMDKAKGCQDDYTDLHDSILRSAAINELSTEKVRKLESKLNSYSPLIVGGI